VFELLNPQLSSKSITQSNYVLEGQQWQFLGPGQGGTVPMQFCSTPPQFRGNPGFFAK